MSVPGQHLVIAGFVGSRHHEVAEALAKRLERPFVNTLTPHAIGSLLTEQYDAANEHEAEAIASVWNKPPSVLAVRTEPFARGRVFNSLSLLRKEKGCVTVFMDVQLALVAASARSDRYPASYRDIAAYELFNDNYPSNISNAKAQADIYLAVGNIASVPRVTNDLIRRLEAYGKAHPASQQAA